MLREEVYIPSQGISWEGDGGCVAPYSSCAFLPPSCCVPDLSGSIVVTIDNPGGTSWHAWPLGSLNEAWLLLVACSLSFPIKYGVASVRCVYSLGLPKRRGSRTRIVLECQPIAVSDNSTFHLLASACRPIASTPRPSGPTWPGSHHQYLPILDLKIKNL